MAKSYSGGINLTTSYKLNNPSPIADYMVVQLYSDLEALPNQFVGMTVFCEADNNTYVKKSTGWEAISKGFNEVYVGSVEPTDTEELWIDPSANDVLNFAAKTKQYQIWLQEGSWQPIYKANSIVIDYWFYFYEDNRFIIREYMFVDIIMSIETREISDAAEFLIAETVDDNINRGHLNILCNNKPTADIVAYLNIYE